MKLSLQHILLESLKPYAHSQKIWVACSGGLDSMVLLDVAREVITKQFDMPIAVLHVNHHLNEAASDWQQLVADYCQQYNIECHAKQLSPENKSNVELWAREQRYQFFESMLQNNELLLMAHHQQDNIETFLQHLLRGSGLDGLSAIPSIRALGKGVLLRPLLSCTQQDLINYQINHDIPFAEDPSNQELIYARNFLRHQVLPNIRQQWPQANERLEQSILHIQNSNKLLKKYLWPEFLSLFDALQMSIDLNKFYNYDTAEQIWFIREWLKYFNLAIPNQTTLSEFIRQIHLQNNQSCLAIDASKNINIKRYQHKLYLTKQIPDVNKSINHWNIDKPLDCFEGFTYQADELFSENQLSYLVDNKVELKWNVTGKSAKKYWQTKKVPPWCRQLLPFFIMDMHLVHEIDYEHIIKDWHFRLI